jgi:pimeloyl-ACP methyl ester carboxylesterase
VTARYLETNAPIARALIWPDVAHMIGMEQPERLAGAIIDFLAPLERWS